MELELLLIEAELEKPGVGMPEEVVEMVRLGWVARIDEFLAADDMAWSLWFLLLHRFLKANDHLQC